MFVFGDDGRVREGPVVEISHSDWPQARRIGYGYDPTSRQRDRGLQLSPVGPATPGTQVDICGMHNLRFSPACVAPGVRVARKKKKFANVRSWMIDAAELDNAETISRYGKSYLFQNDAISKFLNPKKGDREAESFIVAPKGYGKTLLLKAKRAAVYGADPNTYLIPRDSMIDRVPGRPRQPTREEAENQSNDLQFWKGNWSIAIVLSVLQAVSREDLRQVKCSLTSNLYNARDPSSPGDVMSKILNLEHNEYHNVQAACDHEIYSPYRALRVPVAVFIDNLDEFFDYALPSGDHKGVLYRNKSQMLWATAQIGLMEAVRSLRDLNQHVKIYAAIRREVLRIAYEVTSSAQQLEGISLDITYNKDELLEIFRRNIMFEDRQALENQDASDPVERFVGGKHKTINHVYTNQNEEFFEFVFRHTMGRPRDLMFIGRAISQSRPLPRTERALRKAVYAGAQSSVYKHFADMRPFMPVAEMDICKFIDKNVLKKVDLERIVSEYASYCEAFGKSLIEHPFCSLFSMGLLGVIQRDYEGETIQSFCAPDAINQDRTFLILPNSEFYLIHPSLDEICNTMHGEGYRRSFERVNIIGDELPWNSHRDVMYVAYGDIVSSSKYRKDVEYGPLMSRLLEEAVVHCSGTVRYKSRTEGDSIIIIDGSAVAVLVAARELARRLGSHPRFPLSVRFGASSGPIDFIVHADHDGREGKASIPEGWAIRSASRLEKLASSGKMLVDTTFAQAAVSGGVSITDLKRISENDLPGVESDGTSFSIKKSEADPEIVTELWSIDIY